MGHTSLPFLNITEQRANEQASFVEFFEHHHQLDIRAFLITTISSAISNF
jgi:hypothetical protein